MVTTKTLVNNLNILRNSQNTLINDTQKLAGGLNLTQLVLRSHRRELNDLHTSLLGFKNRLHVINEELIYLFKQSGINYVLLHVDYLIDRLTECERIFHSQITQLHEVLRVVTHGQVTPVLISPEEIRSALNKIARKIPIDLQLSFEDDFDIWHVYKYSIAILVLHDDEIHLIIKYHLLTEIFLYPLSEHMAYWFLCLGMLLLIPKSEFLFSTI